MFSNCIILNISHGTLWFISKRGAFHSTREDSTKLGVDVSVSYSQHSFTRAGHQLPVDRIEFYAIHTAFLASYEHSDLLTKACKNTIIVSSAAKTTGTDRHTGHCMVDIECTCFLPFPLTSFECINTFSELYMMIHLSRVEETLAK